MKAIYLRWQSRLQGKTRFAMLVSLRSTGSSFLPQALPVVYRLIDNMTDMATYSCRDTQQRAHSGVDAVAYLAGTPRSSTHHVNNKFWLKIGARHPAAAGPDWPSDVFPARRGDENPRLAILVRSFISPSIELHAHRPTMLPLIPPNVTLTPTRNGP